MVRRETSEVVSKEGFRGVRVAYGLKGRRSSRLLRVYYEYHRRGS